MSDRWLFSDAVGGAQLARISPAQRFGREVETKSLPRQAPGKRVPTAIVLRWISCETSGVYSLYADANYLLIVYAKNHP